MYYQPGFVICVAETQEEDDTLEGSAHVVEFASWYWHGMSETALKWHKDTITNSTYKLSIHRASSLKLTRLKKSNDFFTNCVVRPRFSST
jgi:hypothetical protein